MSRAEERDPEACEHEKARFEGKTICDVKGREVYTNCREVGHCVLGGDDGHWERKLTARPCRYQEALADESGWGRLL